MALLLTERPNSPEATLAAFLRAQAGEFFAWGERDCGLWLADWIAYYRGIEDPAQDWRGKYRDEAACLRRLAGTPFPLLVSRLARRAGLHATDKPGLGAVAVIIVNDKAVGAIRTERGWAVVAPRGIVGIRYNARVLRAWEA